jgi:hypothetical protein
MKVAVIHSNQSATPRASRLPLVGVLLVQLLDSYEWFVSGLSKVGSLWSEQRPKRAPATTPAQLLGRSLT